MRRAALVLTALMACEGAPDEGPPPVTDETASTIGAAAEHEGGAATEAEEPPVPADALARRVWAAAGGERLDEVAQIDFRFVVRAPAEEGGETLFEAAHRWDRKTGRDRVSWTDGEGVLREAVVDLGQRTACGHVDGEPVTGEAREELAEAAYARWVNDAYWLMVPLKVLDPGVRRAVLEGDEGGLALLELAFDQVGLTPGDRYVLHVDEEDRIVRWEMQLEGSEPPMKAVTFAEHTDVGPLTLPLDHVDEQSGRHITLTDVEAHEAVVPEDFVLRGCPAG